MNPKFWMPRSSRCEAARWPIRTSSVPTIGMLGSGMTPQTFTQGFPIRLIVSTRPSLKT